MEARERNRIMDGYLQDMVDFPGQGPKSAERRAATRECDKLARAWDTVYKEMQEQTGLCAAWHREFMDNALTPTPKDPLEELRVVIKKVSVWRLGSNKLMIAVDPLLEVVNKTLDELKREQVEHLDPLEELEQTIKNMTPWGMSHVGPNTSTQPKILLNREDVLAEIRRLRGKN